MASQDLVDVAIIGAGVFGLAAALTLRARGLSVLVVEQGAPGAGSSGGTVGVLAPHMPEKWNAKKAFQLKALRSAEAFWRGVDAISGQATGYGRVGRVMPIETEHGRVLAEARAAEAETLWDGFARFEVLDRPPIPGLPAAPHGHVRETLTARLYPSAAVAALAAACEASGVTIETGHGDPELLRQRAGTVVVAAGSGAAPLLPSLPEGFLSTVKGQSALLGASLPGAPVYYAPGLYIVDHPGHGVAIGSTSEPDRTDLTTDDQLDALIAKAEATLLVLKGAKVLRRWAGLRPRARFPDPVIGPVPEMDGVWLLTGGFKIGFGIAHEMAEALARGLTGEDMDLPPRFHLAAQLEG